MPKENFSLSYLVDPDVAKVYQEMAGGYRDRYGRRVDDENLAEKFDIPSPIERIFLGGVDMGSGKDVLLNGGAGGGVVAAIKGGGSVVYFDGSLKKLNLPKEKNVKISAIIPIGPNRVVVGTENGELLLIDGEGALLYIHAIPGDVGRIAGMESVINSSKTTIAVTTGINSVYFVSVSYSGSAVSMSHQLLISPIEDAIVGMKAADALLAILTCKSVIIVSVENLSKPKILHKISNLVDAQFCQWIGSRGLWVRLRERELWVERVGDSFVQKRVVGIKPGGEIFFISENVGIEYVSGGPSVSGGFRLCGIEVVGDKVEYTSYPFGYLSVPDVCVAALVGSTVVTATIPSAGQIDFHSISVNSWSDILRSQLHGQNWDACMHLIRAQNILPGPKPEKELISEVFTKALTQCPVDLVCGAAVSGGVLAILEDSIHSSEVEQRVLEAIVRMVVDGKISPTCLTSSIVNRSIQLMSTQTPVAVGTLGDYMALVLLGSVPLDIDMVIRVASTLDLWLPLILVHVLLKDFNFGIDYLLAKGYMKELGWYMCCGAEGLLYPLGSVGGTRYAEFDYGRILSKWKGDAKFFWNSIPFRLDLIRLGGNQQTLYAVKAALAEDREIDIEFVEKFVSVKNPLEILTTVLGTDSNPEFSIQFINRFDLSVCGEDVMEVVKVIASAVADKEVLGEIISRKFVNVVQLSELVQFFLRENDYVTCSWLLERRRSFDRLTELIERVVGGGCDKDVIRAVVEIVKKSGKNFDKTQLAKISVDIINKFPDLVGNDQTFLSQLDMSLVIPHLTAFTSLRHCFEYLHLKNLFAIQTQKISAIDVGCLFRDFVERNKDPSGITATATLCHVCLETLVVGKKHQKLCVFTCGHMAHQNCCEFFQNKQKQPKCPVCV